MPGAKAAGLACYFKPLQQRHSAKDTCYKWGILERERYMLSLWEYRGRDSLSAPKNPWKTLGVKSIYENPWLRLEEHDVINPAGGKNLYGKICFLNQAVGVIPLDEAGNTWLVGQHRYTLDDYSWEIPEGGSPLGEDPMETARRELREETGLIAQDIQLLLSLHTSNSVTDEVGFIYLAKGLELGETEHEDTEDITVRKLPLNEAIDMAINGKITDAMSLAGLYRLALDIR